MNWGNTTPPQIQGDSTDNEHLKWIVLDSAQWGITQKNVPQGGGKPPADVMEIQVTKTQDNASSTLFRAAVTGTLKPETVMLDVKRDDNSVLSLRLSNTMISNYATSGDLEGFSLKFTRVEWGNNPYLTPHTTTPPLPSFNLVNAGR